MEDIIKIVKSLEDSGLLLIIQNEAKEQKRDMLLGKLGASLLGNILTGKVINTVGYGSKKGKGITRAGYGSKLDF